MAKILIVDDAAFVRMRLKNLLTPVGHTIIEAENGETGIETYKNESPDLVIMDVNMPGMDGIVALQEIIKFDKNAKVIILTNLAQQESIMQAVKFGAKNYLVKPLDEAKLLTQVKKFTEINP